MNFLINRSMRELGYFSVRYFNRDMYNKKAIKLYDQGLVFYRNGKLSDAIRSYKMAIKINSDFVEAYNNLGNAYLDKGNMREAYNAYKRAYDILPDHPIVLSNLGNALQLQGKNNKAVSVLNKAISNDPNYSDAYNNLGNALRDLGDSQGAINSYSRAIEIDRDADDVYNNLGGVLREVGQLEDAINNFIKAIEINPRHKEAYNGLGNALSDQGNIDAAVRSYNKAIEINPRYKEAYNGLGNALSDQGNIDAAVRSYNKAIEINPRYKEAYNGLGNALSDQGNIDAAVRSYNKAIEINPRYKEAYNGLGNALSDQGNLDEAIGSYNNALNIDPNYSDALWNSSLALLSQGIFNDGWKRYEHGRFSKNYPRRIIALPYPLWSGESLGDKVILVTAEQGVGDEIMFASCMHDLISMHPKRIILECDKRLEPIFRRSFPLVYVAGNRNEEDYDWLSQFDTIDMQVAIGTLPKFFRIDISSFAGGNPYLSVDLLDSKKWKRRFSKAGSRLKIGVSWKGGVNRILQRNRSIELEVLAPVLSLDAFFVNLQYGDCTDEISKFMHSRGICIHDWDDVNPLINLDNFAAEISALDLVISVDNSTVHIAGALGIPVWVLIPYSPDWRWMTGRTDSPWYKTVRLFRQKNFGDWSDVVDEIYSELQVPIR